MRLLSPRELGQALGVSESSLKRWIDAGKIAATRTDGGHRRITLPEAMRFIRETGAPLAHPELLDMPEVAVAHERGIQRTDQLFALIQRGDAPGTRGWIMARYLAGESVAALCDGPIRDAMHALGELWVHDDRGVFIEHRGTDVCLQALAYLRTTFETSPTAPVAIGGGPEDDPYILPSFMASIILASVGVQAINLGPDTPVASMQHAVEAHAPKLVWVSASGKLHPARARAIAHWLAALPATTIALVGGREGRAIASAHPSVRYVETMAELAVIAGRLVS